MQYRPEIDGIRAIAVLAVIAFHAGFSVPSGGFLGVDIFFVISGYLITNIIDDEVTRDVFSIASFYERRMRRILPTLYVVMLCCLPFAWIWQFPAEMREFAKSMIATAIFASNIFFYKTINYFSHNVETYPLIHSWSLAVEEQFYIFYPCLVLFCKSKRSSLTIAIFLITLLSLIYSIIDLKSDSLFGFYMLPTRAWEFCVGAATASFPNGRSSLPTKMKELLALVGLSLLLVSLFYLDQTFPMPGLWTIAPVAGTALLVSFATSSTVVGRSLSLPPLVGIGLISYSAYLWHQPVFAFVRVRIDFGRNIAVSLLLIALTLALAYLTWRFVEKPFRSKSLLTRGRIFAIAAGTTAFMIAIGLAIETEKGFPGRWTKDITPLEAWKHETIARESECAGDSTAFVEPTHSCVYNGATEATVALWGDSHSAVIVNSLARALVPSRTALRQFSFFGCPPIAGVRVPDLNRELCPAYNDLVMMFLRNHKEIKTIIMIARWAMYIDGSRFDNEEGGMTGVAGQFALPIGTSSASFDADHRVSMIGAMFRDQIVMLLHDDRRIVLVEPIPEVGWRVPERMEREIFRHADTGRPAVSTSLDVYKKRSKGIDDLLDRLPNDPNLIRLNPSALFCDAELKGRCLAERDGKPLYVDDNHLSSVGADDLSRLIVAEMQKHGWLPAAN